MKFQVPEGIQDYVKPTEFCDCDCEEIKQKAEELTQNVTSPKEAAIIIFNYVRDQFPLAIGTPEKASKTLQDGKGGECRRKTNLQVALLRAVGIPARYHHVVLHKDVLKGIIPDSMYNRMNERIWSHPWCECYLSGRWIACDLYLDKATYDAAIKNGIIDVDKMPSIDWDGETDLKTTTPWILEDIGTLSSYDEVTKKIREQPKVPDNVLENTNQQIKELRKKI